LAGAVATGSTLASEDRIVVGKNYRLQDIQLSKIFRGKSPLGTYGGTGRFPPDPLRSLTRGAPKPRSVRSRMSLEPLGALPLDQPSYPMDPLASLQAEPLNLCLVHLRRCAATADNLRLARLVACQP
jgi:hypothetical protein